MEKNSYLVIDCDHPNFAAVLIAMAGGTAGSSTTPVAAPAAALKKETPVKSTTDETKQPAMAELLTKYNTTSVTGMNPENYEAFMTDLEKLK